MADMLGIDLQCSIFRSNTMKIANLIMKFRYDLNLTVSTNPEKSAKNVKDKYTGGYVKNPVNKGILKRPVASIDFSSLYPSVMITLNLSSDKIITT